MKKIDKILIANRGEIAIRVARTAIEMNISPVGIYASDDLNSLHLKKMDESIHIGKGALEETYLNIKKIIDGAKNLNCNAIHPGYGFLSENPDFAEACENEGLIFIGPSSVVMRLMGNKLKASEYAKSLGIPTLHNLQLTTGSLSALNGDVQFPVLVKAIAGGGGKAIHIARTKAELADAVEIASREAKAYFANGSVYLEQYLINPRHIEVQILGDIYGNVIHLFERECSLQRRHQKIIEEAPAPYLKDQLRSKIINAAVQIAKSSGYTGAGTVEFLIDGQLNYFFLEMNTRIQVEHAVTEMVTGINIVKEQINIASGTPLSYKQSDIRLKGHAVEARIYAEDPEKKFLPSPGKIHFFYTPQSRKIRNESAIFPGVIIESHYDPLIAKVIAFGNDRKEAVSELSENLKKTVIHGISSNISFLNKILGAKDFLQSNIHVNYVENNLKSLLHKRPYDEERNILSIAAIIAILFHADKKVCSGSVWNYIGFWRQFNRIMLGFREEIFEIGYFGGLRTEMEFYIKDALFHISEIKSQDFVLNFKHCKKEFSFYYSIENHTIWLTSKDNTYTFIRRDVLNKDRIYVDNEINTEEKIVSSPMFGKVLKILKKVNDEIVKDEELLVIESMKMENKITSPVKGQIKEIFVKEGDQVQNKSLLIEFF